MGSPGGELLGTVTPLLMASSGGGGGEGGTFEVSHIVSEKGAGSGITAVSK